MGLPVKTLTGGEVERRLAAGELTELPLIRRLASGGELDHLPPEEARALIDGLLSTGHFCRDSLVGGILHPGLVSIRELAESSGLHICIGPDGAIYAHIDRIPPVTDARPDGRCVYGKHRAAAHIRTDVIPGPTRPHLAPAAAPAAPEWQLLLAAPAAAAAGRIDVQEPSPPVRQVVEFDGRSSLAAAVPERAPP
ncbi:MAG TPA: hypothetical protein VHJ78_01205 [Actinomycetota bacterium]|nr:hypothetical protein [Actinomycetota bacterium]